eukprot:scaffold34630_cov31-Tisochrysis_lutea.AAC.5
MNGRWESHGARRYLHRWQGVRPPGGAGLCRWARGRTSPLGRAVGGSTSPPGRAVGGGREAPTQRAVLLREAPTQPPSHRQSRVDG